MFPEAPEVYPGAAGAHPPPEDEQGDHSAGDVGTSLGILVGTARPVSRELFQLTGQVV